MLEKNKGEFLLSLMASAYVNNQPNELAEYISLFYGNVAAKYAFVESPVVQQQPAASFHQDIPVKLSRECTKSIPSLANLKTELAEKFKKNNVTFSPQETSVLSTYLNKSHNIIHSALMVVKLGEFNSCHESDLRTLLIQEGYIEHVEAYIRILKGIAVAYLEDHDQNLIAALRELAAELLNVNPRSQNNSFPARQADNAEERKSNVSEVIVPQNSISQPNQGDKNLSVLRALVMGLLNARSQSQELAQVEEEKSFALKEVPISEPEIRSQLELLKTKLQEEQKGTQETLGALKPSQALENNEVDDEVQELIRNQEEDLQQNAVKLALVQKLLEKCKDFTILLGRCLLMQIVPTLQEISNLGIAVPQDKIDDVFINLIMVFHENKEIFVEKAVDQLVKYLPPVVAASSVTPPQLGQREQQEQKEQAAVSTLPEQAELKPNKLETLLSEVEQQELSSLPPALQNKWKVNAGRLVRFHNVNDKKQQISLLFQKIKKINEKPNKDDDICRPKPR
jgi:hypothetical protein